MWKYACIATPTEQRKPYILYSTLPRTIGTETILLFSIHNTKPTPPHYAHKPPLLFGYALTWKRINTEYAYAVGMLRKKNQHAKQFQNHSFTIDGKLS